MLFLISYLNSDEDSFRKSAKKTILEISEEIGGRPTGSRADSLTQNYLITKFNELGLQAKRQFIGEFSFDNKTLYVNSSNIISKVYGVDTNKCIILGAHYDTVADDVKGANDNATGIAVLLELAKYYQKHQPKYSIYFVAFAAEENNLLGSRYFVSNFRNTRNIKAMLNFDMLGKGQLVLSPSSKGVPSWAVDFTADAISSGVKANVNMSNIFFTGASILAKDRLDHSSFIHKNIPAMSFSSRVIPAQYHSSEDKEEYIEYGNLHGVYDLSLSIIKSIITEEKLNESANYFVLNIPGLNKHFVIDNSYILVLLINVFFILIIQLVKAKKNIKIPRSKKEIAVLFKQIIPLLIFITFWIGSESLLGMNYGSPYYWMGGQITIFIYSSLTAILALVFINKYFHIEVGINYFLFISSIIFLTILFIFIGIALAFTAVIAFFFLNRVFYSSSLVNKILFLTLSILIFISVFTLSSYSYLLIDSGVNLEWYTIYMMAFLIVSPFYFAFQDIYEFWAYQKTQRMILLSIISILSVSLYIFLINSNLVSDYSKFTSYAYLDWFHNEDGKETSNLFVENEEAKSLLKKKLLNRVSLENGPWLKVVDLPAYVQLNSELDSLSVHNDTISIVVKLKANVKEICQQLSFNYYAFRENDPKSTKKIRSYQVFSSQKNFSDSTKLQLQIGENLAISISAKSIGNLLDLPIQNNNQLISTRGKFTFNKILN